MAESGVKNACNVPYADVEGEEKAYADFFTQKKLHVVRPSHFEQRRSETIGNRRGNPHPVKKKKFHIKYFPHGQLLRVRRPHYLRRDSQASKSVLDNNLGIDYYEDQELIDRLPAIYHQLFEFWIADGFAGYHTAKPTWRCLEWLYGHRIKPKKNKCLHELETRQEKLRFLYNRADIAIDGVVTDEYLERHFGHLIDELDAHIKIAREEKLKAEDENATGASQAESS